MFAEAIGGWFANSLALLADAGHMLTDAGALALTLGAIWIAARPANDRKTYGYYRWEILAALLNSVTLVLLSIWVIYEAFVRWSEPPEVKGWEMTLVAIGGLAINLISAWLLHSDHKHDLNIRGAWLHVMGDALGSVAAIVAGVLIINFGWNQADVVSSIIISIIIIYGSINLFRETVNVLLEGTPAHINLNAVETTILQTEGVNTVHDLHVWSISSGIVALSAHVQHGDEIVQPELLKLLRKRLHDEFGIDHLTIQMETPDFEDENVHFCQSGSQCFISKTHTKVLHN